MKFPISRLKTIMDVVIDRELNDTLSGTEMMELSNSIGKQLLEEESDTFYDDQDFDDEEVED